MNEKCLLLSIGGSMQQLYKVFSPAHMAGIPVRSIEEIRLNPMPETEYIFGTWGFPVMEEAEIAALFPKLKMVLYAAGSVQFFARPFLARGVRVCSAWAANAVPVAEFAAAQIVLANKGYFQLSERYRKGAEGAVTYAMGFQEGNYGAKVGLLGAGMIGQHVIRLLKAYALEIWVYDPYISAEKAAALGVVKKELAEVFANCRTVSNHMANKPETVGVLGYTLFSSMLPNATFINTGRAAQVVKADLLRAMAECPDRTALLDVTDPEEPLLPDSEYWDYPNVFHTPHRAGSMELETRRMAQYVMDEYARLLAGEPLLYEVTLEMLTTMA